MIARFVTFENILWAGAVALALCVGVLLGRISAFIVSVQSDPPAVLQGTESETATVILDGFRDGAFYGKSIGPVRLYVRDTVVETESDGSFAVVDPAFRIEEVTIVVPPGMRFVASKKGKKYYTVESAGGANIVPENRVYFETAEAAEAAGYTR